jgi:hypothetical protein
MFSSRSQWVLTRFPMCSTRVFSVAFFPCSQCVPSYVFPSRSQWVPIKFPICSPTLFSVAPHFYHMCFGFKIEPSNLGSLQKISFFLSDGLIKLAGCNNNNNKIELGWHLMR